MYIGKAPQLQGAYDKADSIHSSFNGATVAFDIKVSSTSKSIAKATNLLVSFYDLSETKRYIMEPDTDYTVSGSTITFTVAPASGDTCWIMIFGDVFDVGEYGSINQMTDVDTTTAAPSDGDVLKWNDTNSEWEPLTLDIDHLSDVDTTTAAPSDGDLLKWNNGNSEWEPLTLNIDHISDVDTTTVAPSTGDFLKWDGSNWTPSAT